MLVAVRPSAKSLLSALSLSSLYASLLLLPSRSQLKLSLELEERVPQVVRLMSPANFTVSDRVLGSAKIGLEFSPATKAKRK